MSLSQTPIPELSAITIAVTRAQERNPSGWSELSASNKWLVYSDGSAPFVNPGGDIGFSSIFVLDPERAWDLFGGVEGRSEEPATSNNRAEIAGALAVLQCFYQLKLEEKPLPSAIEIVCDSQYVVHCAQGKWKKHKNKDLWRRFDQLLSVLRQQKTHLEFRWTRAHVGTKWNERADQLAKEGAYLGKGAPCSPTDERVAPVAEKVHAHYRLRLFAEMTGRASATGVYSLEVGQRRRKKELNLKKVITLDEAEYFLLSAAFKDLEETLIEAQKDPKSYSVEVESSRDLMLKQLQGYYAVKSERLLAIYPLVCQKAAKFEKIHWTKASKTQMEPLLTSE